VPVAGHTKRVTAAVWGQGSLLVTGSNDKTVRFWKHTAAEGDDAGVMAGSWACAATATEHEAEVRGLALHPSRVYGVSVSADASWAWWDLAEAKCLKQVRGLLLAAAGFFVGLC
jgi:pre-mRNA-processing factor 19